MKIKATEKVVLKFGGSYNYFTYLEYEFLELQTKKHRLFPEEMKEICKLMKESNFEYHYLQARRKGIVLNFYRKA